MPVLAGLLTLATLGSTAFAAPSFSLPVSYTHLDVYKRQPPGRSHATEWARAVPLPSARTVPMPEYRNPEWENCAASKFKVASDTLSKSPKVLGRTRVVYKD